MKKTIFGVIVAVVLLVLTVLAFDSYAVVDSGTRGLHFYVW